MKYSVNARPIGRLGNQMFQVAATLGYAKKNGLHWGFPSDTKEVPNLRKFFPNIPVLDGHFRGYNVADPIQFNYRPIPLLNQDTTLVGFFQSEKWFEGANDDVRNLFKLDITPNESISLHIRRGDYVQHANSFPPVDLVYIRQAVDFFREVSFDNFMVFSDDIDWCRRVLPDSLLDQKFIFSEGKNELEDLSLMASCKHNIIANSTFSWWAAWLNNNPEKIVVSPSYLNWFGPGFSGSPPVDLIPSSWHQIKFR